jgi:hypothetical protein
VSTYSCTIDGFDGKKKCSVTIEGQLLLVQSDDKKRLEYVFLKNVDKIFVDTIGKNVRRVALVVKGAGAATVDMTDGDADSYIQELLQSIC